MRILCLHGYRQSGQGFRQKTGAFRKLLKSMPSGRPLHYDFLDAPHVVDQAAIAEAGNSEMGNNSGFFGFERRSADQSQRAWWFSKLPCGFNASEPSDWERGLQESLELVVNELRKRRYAGLLGFSQGAAMAFLVLRHLELADIRSRPHFGILIAPFKSPCSVHEAFYTGRLKTPCLVVSGETDQVIPRPMTEALLPLFAKLYFLGHSAGHIVPAKSELKAKFLDFLRMFDDAP